MGSENEQQVTLVNLNGLQMGYYLKLKRTSLGLYQKDVARILGMSDVSAISKVETGKRELPMEYRKRALEFLGMEVYEDEK